MFSVYIDDSGTDPNQRAAIATAFVVPAAQIIPLEREWDNLKKKYGFSDFHTSEMVARNYKSDFADWDETKQKKVFQRVREISKKYGIRAAAVSFAVNKVDYDNLVPLEYRNYFGGHYTWAIRHGINFLEAWRQSRNIAPFEYVFDWAEPGSIERIEIETVMAQAESIYQQRGRSGEFTNHTFRRQRTSRHCNAWMLLDGLVINKHSCSFIRFPCTNLRMRRGKGMKRTWNRTDGYSVLRSGRTI